MLNNGFCPVLARAVKQLGGQTTCKAPSSHGQPYRGPVDTMLWVRGWQCGYVRMRVLGAHLKGGGGEKRGGMERLGCRCSCCGMDMNWTHHVIRR